MAILPAGCCQLHAVLQLLSVLQTAQTQAYLIPDPDRFQRHLRAFQDPPNRQIAVLEYGDPSGRLLNFLGEVNSLTVFSWYHVVAIKDSHSCPRID